jgi:hypothetical protein
MFKSQQTPGKPTYLKLPVVSGSPSESQVHLIDHELLSITDGLRHSDKEELQSLRATNPTYIHLLHSSDYFTSSTLHHLMPFLTLDPEDDEQPK